jgi:hypothetical protein
VGRTCDKGVNRGHEIARAAHQRGSALRLPVRALMIGACYSFSEQNSCACTLVWEGEVARG